VASGRTRNADISSTNDVVTTTGDNGFGAFAYADPGGVGSGSIEIANGSFKTSGDSAYALVAQGDYLADAHGATASIIADGVSIATTGDSADGAYAYGANLDLRKAD